MMKKGILIFVIGLLLINAMMTINYFRRLNESKKMQVISFESTSDSPLQERYIPPKNQNQNQKFKSNEPVTVNGEAVENYEGNIPNLTYNEFERSLNKKTSNYLNGWHTYTWSNGDSYTGHWVDGRMDGGGIYTWVDGVWYETQFKKGFPVNNSFEFEGKIYRVFR